MKVIILAGGFGTRLGNQPKLRPKPMVQIGKEPIIIHIMNIYRKFNFKEFIIAGGYKYKIVRDYFKKKKFKGLKITVINTGLRSMTGGRIFKLKKYIKEKQFMLTYGDGLANVNINRLISFHNKNGKIATISIVRPPARWGYVKLKSNLVSKFEEKNQLNEGWINGGFFVMEKKIFNIFEKFSYKKDIILETDILPLLSKKKELSAFKHMGFWQCMDTPRDKIFLKNLVKNKKTPWMNFKNEKKI